MIKMIKVLKIEILKLTFAFPGGALVFEAFGSSVKIH